MAELRSESISGDKQRPEDLPQVNQYQEAAADRTKPTARNDYHQASSPGLADCHPGLMHVHLQTLVDEKLLADMENCTKAEQEVRKRMLHMQAMLSGLLDHRKSLEDGLEETEAERIDRMTQLERQIQEFREEHWPMIQETHSTIGVSQFDPFPNGHWLDTLPTADHIDGAMDNLRQLLGEDQYKLTQVTREMTQATTNAELISTVHSHRRPGRDTERMVSNQTIGLR